MNYYPHHIGDFNSATRHLTRVERSLYRDLIELYYDTEQPLDSVNFDRLSRKVIAVSEEEKTALQYVLDEFFELDGDFYHHARCDDELAKYHANASAKVKAGKASAEARRKRAEEKRRKQGSTQQNSTPVEQPLNGCSTQHEQNPTNQEPRTINQEPIKTSSKKFDDDDLNLAKNFFEKILLINPKNKIPNFESWANDIRKTRELDNRTRDEIRELFDWANKHKFWSQNILSPKSLRDKWDQLTIQRNSSGAKKHGSFSERDYTAGSEAFGDADWAS